VITVIQPLSQRSLRFAPTFAVAYVIGYLAFSVPAVIAGFASTSVGLRSTAVVYGLGVVALGLTALAGQRMRTVGP
jgi:hypothetical protein